MSQANPTSVFDELVGQDKVVQVLRQAIEAAHNPSNQAGQNAMTHAWLFCGPPGCGRSNAAIAFAAGLLCDKGGCGQCRSCKSVLNGSNPDVTLVHTEALSIGIDQVRELVTKSAMRPTVGRYQVIIIEDCDRVTDQGADAMLKSLEEPPPTTVWLLCAPTPDDVIVTIRSRTRKIALRAPTDDEVAELLIKRDGVDAELANQVARISQGHIGRARGLAEDESLRAEYDRICRIPAELTGVGAALEIAQELLDMADEQGKSRSSQLDAQELAALKHALGMDERGAKPANVQAAIKALEEEQKVRAKRMQRDILDGYLTILSTWYRDLLLCQLAGSDQAKIVNIGWLKQLNKEAESSSPEANIAKLQAILATRESIMRNVSPLLALESMLLKLSQAG